MTVDAVLFDLDDTLCEYRRPATDVLSAAFDRIGVEPWFTIETFYDRFDEFAQPGDDIRDLRRRSFAAFAEAKGFDADVGRAVAEAFEAERDQSNVGFLPGAREAFETATEQYRVGIVTNGDPWMQSQKLAGLGIADRLETVVHGGHDAAYKPDPEPFDTALAELGVEEHRAVHVGNSLSADVVGAHNAGVRSVWLDGDSEIDPEPEPDYRVESMHDVAAEPWT